MLFPERFSNIFTTSCVCLDTTVDHDIEYDSVDLIKFLIHIVTTLTTGRCTQNNPHSLCLF